MVEGRDAVVKTDHEPLTFAFEQKSLNASPRQLRHLDSIGQFTTELRYVKGHENVIVFSRIEAIEMPVVTTEALTNAQRADEE